MERAGLEALLRAVADGTVAPGDAAARLAAGPLGADGSGVTDLGFARVDTHRPLRTGEPEVVYAEGKTPDQVVAIVASLRAAGQPALVTRADSDVQAALRAVHSDAAIDEQARCILVRPPDGSGSTPAGRVAVVSAGTADGPVAAEAAFTATALGLAVDRICDVGVAGVHRLLAVRPRLEQADCVIVVAGMEGALPSVVAGLVSAPVVAVPTSVGYGVATGGVAALHAMLASCTPGIAVCNIDNGFGAGVFAARVARAAASAAIDRQPADG